MATSKRGPKLALVQTSIYARTAVAEPAPLTAPVKVAAQADLFAALATAPGVAGTGGTHR
jgi:hypothetical protein